MILYDGTRRAIVGRDTEDGRISIIGKFIGGNHP